MDGLFRCLTAPVGVMLGGQTFSLEPLTLAGFAQIELHLLAARRSPIDDAASLPEEVQRLAVADVAGDKSLRVVRLKELYRWLDTPAGTAFTGWLCLRPTFASLAACQTFFAGLTSADLVEFTRRRDMASGMDMLSHLDWPGEVSADADSFIQWKRLFRWAADEHHWTPEQIGRLTLHQLRIYRVAESSLGGRTKMSPAEAFHFMENRKSGYRGGRDPQTMPSRVEARRKMIERRHARKK